MNKCWNSICFQFRHTYKRSYRHTPEDNSQFNFCRKPSDAILFIFRAKITCFAFSNSPFLSSSPSVENISPPFSFFFDVHRNGVKQADFLFKLDPLFFALYSRVDRVGRQLRGLRTRMRYELRLQVDWLMCFTRWYSERSLFIFWCVLYVFSMILLQDTTFTWSSSQSVVLYHKRKKW